MDIYRVLVIDENEQTVFTHLVNHASYVEAIREASQWKKFISDAMFKRDYRVVIEKENNSKFEKMDVNKETMDIISSYTVNKFNELQTKDINNQIKQLNDIINKVNPFQNGIIDDYNKFMDEPRAIELLTNISETLEIVSDYIKKIKEI